MRRVSPVRRFARISGALLALAALGAGVGVVALAMWANGRIRHVEALSGAADTTGTTYLIVGSDSREGWAEDGTEGARTDTIMVLHVPEEGPVALISIPRDSYVAIPGHNPNKINAAYAWGGPSLIVQTVEGATGLTIDHYLEVGFGGVADVVNAVGGVELCYDRDVDDPYSQLRWTAGCHVVDGRTALAFSRMRYEDPLGDIGRTERQRQVVSAVVSAVTDPAVMYDPRKALPVASAGFDAFQVSEGTGLLDLARLGLALRSGLGEDAVTGTPPLATIDHRVDGVGSTVLIDPDTVDEFWADIATGAYPPGAEVGGLG